MQRDVRCGHTHGYSSLASDPHQMLPFTVCLADIGSIASQPTGQLLRQPLSRPLNHSSAQTDQASHTCQVSQNTKCPTTLQLIISKQLFFLCMPAFYSILPVCLGQCLASLSIFPPFFSILHNSRGNLCCLQACKVGRTCVP